MDLLGVGADPRFATFDGRAANRDELEHLMREWCAARPQVEVLRAFEEAEAAIGPILDMADIAADPHYLARQAVVNVGDTPMQNLIARLSRTPGELRHPGRALDADGDDIRRKGWEHD
jgi:crotonobetainyl-CoA:carnitine CoA-transferase CaiB-like acyl-CoA transferase